MNARRASVFDGEASVVWSAPPRTARKVKTKVGRSSIILRRNRAVKELVEVMQESLLPNKKNYSDYSFRDRGRPVTIEGQRGDCQWAESLCSKV
jgi:hypothetical protein